MAEVSSSNPLADALATLEAGERALSARIDAANIELTATRTALKALRSVIKTPRSKPFERKARARRDAAPESPIRSTRATKGEPHGETVRDLLKDGPVTVARFRQAFNLKPLKARQVMAALEAKGLLTVTGVKAARRIALVGAAPAKEAP